MSNYIVTDTELTSIADTIRTKSGQSGSLSFPSGFVSGINSISGGGSGEISFNGLTLSYLDINDLTLMDTQHYRFPTAYQGALAYGLVAHITISSKNYSDNAIFFSTCNLDGTGQLSYSIFRLSHLDNSWFNFIYAINLNVSGEAFDDYATCIIEINQMSSGGMDYDYSGVDNLYLWDSTHNMEWFEIDEFTPVGFLVIK